MSDTRICGRLGAMVVFFTSISYVSYTGYYPPMEVLIACGFGSSIRKSIHYMYDNRACAYVDTRSFLLNGPTKGKAHTAPSECRIDQHSSASPPQRPSDGMFGGRRRRGMWLVLRGVSYRATRPGGWPWMVWIRMKRLVLHQTPPPGQAYELVTSKMAIRAGEA